MSFFNIYIWGLIITIGFMSLIWMVSVIKKDASIVDIFWGTGFVLLNFFYHFLCRGTGARDILLLVLVTIWGLRLSIYIYWRNRGKGEDFRYQEFRRKYGPERYWWISFFQVFMLQGILMWLISAPLLGARHLRPSPALNWWDGLAIFIWIIGFTFEAGGDYQLAKFKKQKQKVASASTTGQNTSTKVPAQVLDTGFWKYTRHPNYFGDSCVWWAYGLFSIAAGNIYSIYGSVLMTLLIIRVSGVMLLEKTLIQTKPHYREYIERTSAFFPWPPKKQVLEKGAGFQ